MLRQPSLTKKNEECVHIKTCSWMNVHGSIIHNSQKVETIQMSINWWTDKQNLVCPYKEILFDNKRNEVVIQAVTWMTLKHYTKSQKIPNYVIAFIWNVQKRKIHGDKKADLWLPAVLSCSSLVQLFATPWTVSHLTPLSVGFSRQEQGWGNSGKIGSDC